jgi:hypothetical protein
MLSDFIEIKNSLGETGSAARAAVFMTKK